MHQFVDLESGFAAVLEQPRSGVEFEGCCGPRGFRAAGLARAHDEAAADAVELLAGEHGAGGIVRGEAHAVRVPGQHLIEVEQQVQRLVEGDLPPAEQADPAGAADALQCRFDGGGVERIGRHALEAEQDGAVGAVAAAGEGQRAVELRRHLVGGVEQAALLEQRHEAVRRIHRTHGVGARGADADLENIEDAE